MYLTKLNLQISSRVVREAVGDCQYMHQLLSGLYGCDRSSGQLLYRLKPGAMEWSVYAYSAQQAKPEQLKTGMTIAGERELSDWLTLLHTGGVYGFDLLTMPAKKIPAENGRNSQRRVIRDPAERLAWLSRKAQQNGFEILSVQEGACQKLCGTHRAERGGRFYLDTWRYTGLLKVTDAALFQKAVSCGIGPEKAYGLGMLLLRK